jgi:nicotinamidase-related amidase
MTSRNGYGGAGIAPNAWAARLRRERTVLLVVDLQERLLPAVWGRERVLSNALLLIQAAHLLDVPIVLTTQYRKGLGDVVPELREALPGTTAIDKISFGCFGCEEFVEWFVQRPGRDQLLLAGIESHVCVFQTAVGALDRGLTTHVATDAVSSRSESNHQIGLARMQRAGAILSSVEMAIYELLERAEGEAFRKILPLVKNA